ncbi:MAG: hybrid sensor histidine kinase/response regulator [Bdellovibrio sp.]|nr:hybrid sensor histidine kinase/response regulator [Bdellovibrio sp.]
MKARRLTLAHKITLVMLGLVFSTSVVLIATFTIGNKYNLIGQQTSELEDHVAYLSPLILRNIDHLTLQAQKLSDLFIETLQFREEQSKIDDILLHVVKTNHYLLDASFELSRHKTTVYKLPQGSVNVSTSRTVSKKETTASFSRVFSYNRPEWKMKEIAALTLTWPVILPNNEILGILTMTLNFQENVNFAKQLSTSKYHIYLASSDGEYFFNMNQQEAIVNNNLKPHLMQNDYPELDSVFKTTLEEKVIPKVSGYSGLAIHYKRLNLVPSSLTEHFTNENNSLVLLQVIDYWEALNESEHLRKKTYFFAAGLIALAMVIAYAFSKIISRNLNAITDVALRYTRGETDIHVDIASSDEIGVLATAFQAMIHQVNERTRRIQHSEEQAQNAKDKMEEALSANQKLLENTQIQNTEICKISKEKDDLLAVVSHDLKNPLSVIETSMSLIMESCPMLSPENLDLVQRSKRGARLGINLIKDLLDIARLEGGIRFFPEVFDLKKLLNDCAQNFTLSTQDKKIQLLIETINGIEVFADLRRLAQVINNLLSNAIKFTPESGTISILVQEKFQFLRPPFGRRKILQLTIKDNGIGVPKDKLDKIFNKYEQARVEDRENGTGLGLTICQNICELHNGKITVESAEGKGTSFTLALPILTNSEAATEIGCSPHLILISQNLDESNKLKNFLVEQFRTIKVTTLTRENFLESTITAFENPIIMADVFYPKILESIITLRKSDTWNNVPIFILAPKFGKDVLDKSLGIIDGIIEWPSDLAKCLFVLRDYFPDFNWPAYYEKNIIQGSKGTNNPVFTLPMLEKHASKILIVDDSDDTHQLLKIMLKNQPVELLHAYNGIEGTSVYAHHLPDLVLMDVNMPQLDGLMATQAIRSLEAKRSLEHATILAITAADDQRSIERCLQSGMDGAFPKPFSKSKLLTIIHGRSNEKKAA